MIRLFKLFLGLVAFVAFAYFGATVRLGDQTLFGHLHAIAGTKESQELVDGTKRAAEPLVDGVRRRIAGAPAGGGSATPGEATAEGPPAASPDAGPPHETISAGDRQKLRRLIGSADQLHANR